MTRPVLVVGAGWSGAVVANCLAQAGRNVEVLERARVVGGHSRVETLCGVTYEPNGPHLLHTNDARVASLFDKLGLARRPYRFRPLTEIELADGSTRLMSWPIQVHELERLPDWPVIERELAELPDAPGGTDFETYAISLMGHRLYELFIEGYTRKQWGRDPKELSSSFAPKRIDLRRDGCRDLFRDEWQYFPADGVNDAIAAVLGQVAVTCGADVSVYDLARLDASAIVVTAALDEFLHCPGALEWRGVHLRSRYEPADVWGGPISPSVASNGLAWTRTPAYVINRPSMSVPYTRTIETKHASGQKVFGTVVSEEYPGTLSRHYPVATVDHRYENRNRVLQAEVRALLAPTPVYFCGRLAQYTYINQDEAIMGAWDCASTMLADAGVNA